MYDRDCLKIVVINSSSNIYFFLKITQVQISLKIEVKIFKKLKTLLHWLIMGISTILNLRLAAKITMLDDAMSGWQWQKIVEIFAGDEEYQFYFWKFNSKRHP